MYPHTHAFNTAQSAQIILKEPHASLCENPTKGGSGGGEAVPGEAEGVGQGGTAGVERDEEFSVVISDNMT